MLMALGWFYICNRFIQNFLNYQVDAHIFAFKLFTGLSHPDGSTSKGNRYTGEKQNNELNLAIFSDLFFCFCYFISVFLIKLFF